MSHLSATSRSNNDPQVVFDPGNEQRRKSLVLSGDDAPKRRRPKTEDSFSCVVHKLLTVLHPKLHQIAEEPAPGAQSEQQQPQILKSHKLTKRQLSSVTISARILAKKLANVKISMKVKSVFLLTKIHDDTLIAKARDLVLWLLSPDREAPYIVWVEDTFKSNPTFNADGILTDHPASAGRLKFWDTALAKHHPNMFDFVITLGGDGTVLYASWLFQHVVPPVLSFALGSLGFLTKFDFEDYRAILEGAFRKGVSVSLRLRLEGTIMRARKVEGDGEEQGKQEGKQRDIVEVLMAKEGEPERTHEPEVSFEILNDIVIDRGPNASEKSPSPHFFSKTLAQDLSLANQLPTAMSTIELFGDGHHITTVQADGVCISTPTGSTAYNLAAGGSLVHPDNPVISVSGICPHTLSFRPLILPDSMVLKVGVPYDARSSSWASFDGRKRVEMREGDYITISASRFPFASVLPEGGGEEWLTSISRTLQWNSRQRQKAFHD